MDAEYTAVSRPITIDSVALTNYKHYSNFAQDFVKGINFIVGRNGAGKTNLLDALHYLCIGRSFVTPHDKYNVQFGKEFFRVEGHVSRGDRSHRIVAKVSPGSVKEISVDDVKQERIADHIGFIPVVLLSPKDQHLVGGASAERRRFVDFYLSQTDKHYLDDLLAYNRLLAQRNALLKEYGPRAERQLLMAYTKRMVPHAAVIAEARSGFVDALGPQVQRIYDVISDARDMVTLQYKSDLKAHALEQLAKTSIEKDLVLTRTTRGVHRDDLVFDMDARALKRFGSQGQMKTYLIALHLALHGYIAERTGMTPVVLLDDIFDKLDERRMEMLVATLARPHFGQVFITDARPARTREIATRMGAPVRLVEIRDAFVHAVRDYAESEQFVNFTDHDRDQEE